MNTSFIRNNSDTLGIATSLLCFAHCIVTPFLFIAQAGSVTVHDANPVWWRFLDLLFIALSFIAIKRSVKNTSKSFLKYAFWTSWMLLVTIILNEKLSILSLPEWIIYPVSFFLVALHLYNLNDCQCQEKCCKTDVVLKKELYS